MDLIVGEFGVGGGERGGRGGRGGCVCQPTAVSVCSQKLGCVKREARSPCKAASEWRGGMRRAWLGGLDASYQAALEGRKEGLGYRQGLTGTQLPTYHKHKDSAWSRTASQGGLRSKAGLLFNYLIHNRRHCIRLSRRGGPFVALL